MIINVAMFIVEFSTGWIANSSALLADSLDMFGDALVYAFSLYVLHKSGRWRASAALSKGIIIGLLGVTVLIETVNKIFVDVLPEAEKMGAIGLLALVANLSCLLLLMRHRSDDLNMRSTWICSRNDIISNVGVIFAAFLVYMTGTKWPDVVIGFIIAVLFLNSARPILLESYKMLKQQKKV